MIRPLQVALVSVAFVSCSIAAAAPAAAQGEKVSLAAANTSSQLAPGQAVRTDSSAVNQPTITQYGIVGSPAKPLFRRLVRDFADGRFGPYSVVSSDPRTDTIVVKRDAIDSDSWAKWSSCSVGPLEMLDSLRDGIATVTISLEPTKRVTDAAVTAGFEGRYGLTATSNMTTVRCDSRGVLEKDLLMAITTAEAARPRRVAKR